MPALLSRLTIAYGWYEGIVDITTTHYIVFGAATATSIVHFVTTGLSCKATAVRRKAVNGPNGV